MKHLRPGLVVCLTAALAATARGVGGVDLEIRSGDKVTATIDPADESEVFRVTVPGGARLTVKAKAAAKKGAPVRLELRDAVDAVSALGVESGAKTTLSVPAVPSGGEYKVVVASRDGIATGGYSLSCRWVTPTTVLRPLTLPDPGTETLFSFGADGGSVAKIDVTAAAGSSALPRLLRIRAPDGTETDLGSSDLFTAKDVAAGVALRLSGDYVVALDHGGAAGDVTAKVTLRPPKGSKRKIDVSTRAIGGEGLSIAIGRILGADGGTVSVPDLGLGGGLSDISGSAVDIPPGALPVGTAIFVASSPDVNAKGREADLGPSVTFGPDGAKFGEDVTITIPLDLAGVDGDTNLVVVYTRDATGKVRKVPLPYDFSQPGFVSFPSSHFSAYQAGFDLPDDVPGTSSLFTIATFANPPADMTFAFDGSDPNRLWYVAVGGRVQDVAADPGSPTTPFVVRDYSGTGNQTVSGAPRTDFEFGGTLQSLASDGTFVYVGDGPTVWQIDTTTDIVTRFLGDGTPEDSGDDGPAASARIFAADDLAFVSGDLVVVDRQAGRIRRIDGSGTILTIAGTGVSGVSQDGADPLLTSLHEPRGVAESLLSPGVLYVAERGRIRVVDLNQGVVTTLAGGTDGQTGCVEGLGVTARFSTLTSIGYDPSFDRVVVTDGGCQTVVQVDVATRDATIYAGTPGQSGFSADFTSTPRNLRLANPTSVIPVGGSIYFLDSGNLRLRGLSSGGTKK